jgi:undecaprenyl diphosphate synthase
LKATPNKYDLNSIPRHVAIIMDGNGRWAKQRLFARIQGHRRGVESVRAVVRTSGEIGVEYLTLYAFSQENWSRPKNEVDALMNLLEEFLKNEINELNENNVQLHAIGEIEALPDHVRNQLALSKKATASNTGLKLILALSYGSRQEIVRAARQIAQKVARGELSPESVDEKLFSENLFTAEYPDPDLIIRTSGELRLSNFLLWQISYAELVVSPVLWPDFRKEHYLDTLREYSKRERRFGAVEV